MIRQLAVLRRPSVRPYDNGMALVMSPDSCDGDCRIPVNAALTSPISDRAHHRASTRMVVGVDLEFDMVFIDPNTFLLFCAMEQFLSIFC